MEQWKSEPERLEFEHAGFRCLLVRYPLMKLVSIYVGIPEGHPYYGRDCDEIDVALAGDLTFSRSGQGIWQKGYWWIGLDYTRKGDGVHRLPDFIAERLKNVEYAKSECEHLAEQLTIPAIAERAFEREW